jgi:hypothetical protein
MRRIAPHCCSHCCRIQPLHGHRLFFVFVSFVFFVFFVIFVFSGEVLYSVVSAVAAALLALRWGEKSMN